MQTQAVRLSALAFVSTAMVWNGPVRADEPAPFDWTGYYIGAHMGSGHGDTRIANPYKQTFFGDNVPTQEALVGLQGGYNWQAPNSPWVFGAEGELTFLDMNGSNTCFSVDGQVVSSNCRLSTTYLGTLAGRVGYAAGPSGKSLLYLKVGTAFVHNRLVADLNNAFVDVSDTKTVSNKTNWGVLLGAGIEQAIAPAWTVKFEYDYIQTGNFGFAAPPTASVFQNATYDDVPGRATHANHENNLFKVGLNYRFGEDPLVAWSDKSAVRWSQAGWSFEPMLRYWRSSGRFQTNVPLNFASSALLLSRLTYDGLTGSTNEVGGRLDTPWQVFFKGYYGSGHIIGGHMNDEDWGYKLKSGAVLGYSNTVSVLRDSGQRYLTVDGGFDVLHGPDYTVGALAGYNHIFESYGAVSCVAIASDMCEPANNEAFITETDKWDSLRIGVAANWWLTQSLKINVDAAYLPYVRFSGIDNHWRRSLIINESGKGVGTQLEAMLSYYLTEDFSLGLGARYWSLWTTSGTDAFNKALASRNDSYMLERYGVLAQATYRFD